MALVIQALCDACMAHDVTSTGKTVSVSLDSGPAVLVDLCAEHHAELVSPLEELLSTHGRDENGKAVSAPTSRPKRTDKTVECDHCELSFADKTTLSAHMKNKHPDDYPDYMIARGMMPVKCKVRGCGQTFYGPQAIKMHLSRAHGQ